MADKILAEQQAAKAEERAKRDEPDFWDNPVWGGWGYGITTWPTTTDVKTWWP